MKGKNQRESEQVNNEIIRHVYRLPIDEKDQVAIDINKTRYKVINLDVSGVGILVNDDAAIAIGQRLQVITLHLEDSQIQLQGRVVHISPRDFQLICGIKFEKVSEENRRILVDFLRRQKKNIFSNQ